jgi:hypothetical protein
MLSPMAATISRPLYFEHGSSNALPRSFCIQHGCSHRKSSQFAMAMAPRGLASTLKMQEDVPANADLQHLRLKADALVAAFNERYRDAILTPSRPSAPHTPKHQSSVSRSEPATVVRFPISSPSGHAVGGVTTPHPLSRAPPQNISPSSMRVQQAPVAASAPSTSSSDLVYVVLVVRIARNILLHVSLFNTAQVLSCYANVSSSRNRPGARSSCHA